MAVLLLPMSAIPDYQHHMTAARGHSVPSNLSHNSTIVADQPTNKRPKLSLQTTSLTTTYGSLTRGLAPNATAIYTPTTANTLSNTWDLTIRPSPVSRADSPRPLLQVRPSAGPAPAQQPYTYSLPFGVRPILKNSPLPPRAPSVSASPRDSRRRVFFPQPKRVSFRNNLEEQIETKQYVTKHSDMTSSEGEDTSDEEPREESPRPDENSTVTTATSIHHNSPPPNRKRKIRRDSGIYFDTKAEPETKISTTSAASAPEDNTIIKPPPPCKRRKWQSDHSSFGKPIEKEGEALKRNSNFNCNVDPEAQSDILDNTTASESSEEPPSEDQPSAEEEDEADQRTLSPFPAIQGTPDVNVDDSAKSLRETEPGQDDDAGGKKDQETGRLDGRS